MRSGAVAEAALIAGDASGAARDASGLRQQAQSYIQLTKPRIILLFALTGLAAMMMEGSLRLEPLRLWTIFCAIALIGGSANAFNQYLDRDIDAVMERTRKKRPLPQGRLTPRQALGFAVITGVVGTLLLYGYGNALAAALGVGTIAFYAGIYTMWLKRRTPYNIVIGGAAGATAPLIGWAAATGHISLGAFVMFLIVFMWTPPHFWALALCVKDEYAKASVPMLPVVKGERTTRRQIFWYSVFLVPLTLALLFTGDCGWIYFAFAAPLGIEFLRRAWRVLRDTDGKAPWKLFGYSIVYLLVLYAVMIADAVAAEKRPLELEGVGIAEKLGEQVNLDLAFRDEKGQTVKLRSAFDGKRPVLLFLAYYGCPNLCNLFLDGAVQGLKGLKWNPGREFEIVTVSIDPREQPMLASRKKASYLKVFGREGIESGWRFWVNDAEAKVETNYNSRRLAEAVGFGFKYDKRQDQFAHSAAMIVLTPEGKVSRYLYGIDFRPRDLRLALAEAGGNRIGNIVDRILLFCYNYDPQTRKYSLYAMNLMRAGGGVCVLALGSTIFTFWRRGRRSTKLGRHGQGDPS